MKKFLLVSALLIGMVSSYNTIEAQVSVNVSINIGRQPAWGPVGYDYVDFYYFPDINCYFNVNLDLFYYFERGRWFSARYLPYHFRNYDLYGMYKVVLVGVADPWMHNSFHIRDYGRYKGYKNQVVIRDSRDTRYRDSRNNKVAWYSGNKNYNNRTAVSGNNRSSSNERRNISASNSNERRNISANNSNERRNISASNNNERRNVSASTRQQKTDGINQPQRKSDSNQSLSGRSGSSNNTRKESTVARSSGSSNKSQGNNRVASNSERSKSSERSSRSSNRNK